MKKFLFAVVAALAVTSLTERTADAWPFHPNWQKMGFESDQTRGRYPWYQHWPVGTYYPPPAPIPYPTWNAPAGACPGCAPYGPHAPVPGYWYPH